MTAVSAIEQGLEEKINSLKAGDWIYLHPTDDSLLAYFGKYDEVNQDRTVEVGLRFRFKEIFGNKIWVTAGYHYDVDLMVLPTDKILKGDYELYKNEEVNEKMMAGRYNNPNYGLVKAIIESAK